MKAGRSLIAWNALAALLLLSPAASAGEVARGNGPEAVPAKEVASGALPIVSRTEWGARPAQGQMQPQKPIYITIHHSAVAQNRSRDIAQRMRNLQDFSQREERLASGKMKAAWADIPYHYYIAADGRIAEGRDVNFVGDTNTEYDPARHIGVVLEGNFEVEQPGEVQLQALKDLLVLLAGRFHVAPDHIAGHQDYAHTQCPGRHLEPRLPELRAYVTTRLAGKGEAQGTAQGGKAE